MPIYEYECEKCGHQFEREQRMADAPIKTCPECKGRKVNKLISRSSFVLKGGGWYADGYSDASGDKKSADTDSSSSEETDSKKSEKKNSEPEVKEKKSAKKDEKKGSKKKGSKKSAA